MALKAPRLQISLEVLRVNWAWQKKGNSSRRQNDDSDWRRCSQAAMHFGGATPRWETEHVAEHGKHSGERARLADPTSSGSPDRPGGLDQRSLCDERVGGGR